MRFILKVAFWLGLIAFLVPGSGHNGTGVDLSLFSAYSGAQQAFEDMTGFCGRAPKACEAGRSLAVFTGERIGDGVALVYDFVDSRRAPAVATLPAGADPMTTGALDAQTAHRLPAPVPVPVPAPRP